MKKIITLILFLSFTLLFRSSYVLAQAPVIFHDTDNYLAEVEIEESNKSVALSAHKKNYKQHLTSKKVSRKPLPKPVSRSSHKSKPKSLNKNYKPQIAVTRSTTNISTPKSMKNNPTKNIIFKPNYIEPHITNIKYPTVAAKRKPIIVIDPGHGGKDRGTTGRLGTKEKDLVLGYSLAIKKELDKTGKYKVVLTRYDDRFIELPQRVSIARKIGGDVLISVHADSSPNKSTKGFSIYTLSKNRKETEAKKLLANSSREEVVRGVNLSRESRDVKEAIIDLAQESTKEVSDDFAKTVAKHLGRRIQALPKHNRQGSLAVLTGSDVPSVLIELGYLSNIQEEKILLTENHKQKIVTSVTNAINEYFSKFNLVF